MSYFLSQSNISLNQPVDFSEVELQHLLLSRRVKVGEQILAQGPDGKRFTVEVREVKKKTIHAVAISVASVPREPTTKIILFQSVVSEKALDFILQKSTELGAGEIVLWNSANTATRISGEQFLKKQERWNKILWEAAKQSERASIPLLTFLPSIEQVIGRMSQAQTCIVLDASAKKMISEVEQSSVVGLCVGPEGGFKSEEIAIFTQAGAQVVSIGQIVLRAETAALAAVAICSLWS